MLPNTSWARPRAACRAPSAAPAAASSYLARGAAATRATPTSCATCGTTRACRTRWTWATPCEGAAGRAHEGAHAARGQAPQAGRVPTSKGCPEWGRTGAALIKAHVAAWPRQQAGGALAEARAALVMPSQPLLSCSCWVLRPACAGAPRARMWCPPSPPPTSACCCCWQTARRACCGSRMRSGCRRGDGAGGSHGGGCSCTQLPAPHACMRCRVHGHSAQPACLHSPAFLAGPGCGPHAALLAHPDARGGGTPHRPAARCGRRGGGQQALGPHRWVGGWGAWVPVPPACLRSGMPAGNVWRQESHVWLRAFLRGQTQSLLAAPVCCRQRRDGAGGQVAGRAPGQPLPGKLDGKAARLGTQSGCGEAVLHSCPAHPARH